MNRILFSIYLFMLLCLGIFQSLRAENEIKNQLLAGPMVAYTGMREVHIWLQWKTKDSPALSSTFKSIDNSLGYIQIQFWAKKSKLNDSKNDSAIPFHVTSKFKINNRTGITSIPLSLLEPGTTYEYKIFANNKEIKFNYPLEFKTKPLWQWRNNPPNVKFAIGSCNYVNEENYDRPGQKWGKGFDIFENIRKDQPEFFVWMGDNVYLREADWDSESGILHRYSHTRQKKEMQAMLSSMFQLAIWDDHDFGPNDASSSYGLSNITEKIFKDFWPDPSYPSKGIYRSYSWSDIEFFLLDNRTFRTANSNYYSKDRTALGKVQKEWLFNSLSDSKARVKFIVLGGQFINSAKVYENLSNYEEDREEILNFIQKMKIAGVIFLSGDRHHSELSRLDRGNLYPIYEWTISPLTAGLSTTTESEPNQHRVKDSFVTERAYGLIEVEGIGKNRKIQFVTKNTFGKELYRMEIPISNLEKVE